MLIIPEDDVVSLVHHMLALEGQSCNEVSLHFVTTEEICLLHKEFFDDPSPTDCISFPIDIEACDGYRVLGDIFVCPETALIYSKTHDLDANKEVALYIVHGLLHVLGYDDIEESDIVVMREAERRHMKNLESKGLLW